MYSENSSFEVPPSLKSDSRTAKRWYQRWWGILTIIFLALFLSLLVAMIFYVGRTVILLRTGDLTANQLFDNDFSAGLPAQNLNTLATTDDPSRGPKDAKVVIVEFSDFQCPFCGQAYPVVKQILKDYGDRILFVYRDFPIAEIHPQAIIAAMAGECAHEQGKFWPMHDKIFENQANITEADLKIYAIQVGLNSIQFGNCLTSGKYLSEIEADLNDGFNAGIRSTPTFVINGVQLAGVLPFNTFEQIIISELNR